MSIDQDAEADSIESATEANDSVDTGSLVDSQDSDAQDQGGVSDQNAPAEAAQQEDGDGSSTNPNTSLQAADASAEPSWQEKLAIAEKRINDLRSGFSKKSNELDQFRKRYEGVDEAELAEYRKNREMLKKQELPQWNPQSPNHTQFKQTIAKWDLYKEAIQSAGTPEEREVLKRTMGSRFSDKEAQAIEAWEAHQRNEVARMVSDPNAYKEIMRQEAVEAVRAEFQAKAEEDSVNQWFSNPSNAPIVERYRMEMWAKMANEGWPWPMVKELFEARYKADSLQSRVGTADKQSAAARAQTSALKQQVATSRDPATATTKPTDFWKEAMKFAKKHDLPSDHPRVNKYLDDLVKRYREETAS